MIVFIIGPAAVGKSHFCKCWQKLYPEYIKIDELPVVLEYIELDKIITDSKDIKEAGERLCEFENKSNYLKAETKAYLKDLDACGNIPKPRFTKEMDGGFRAIADPNIWDEMMRKICIGLSQKSSYLVEFARGTDPDYLRLHDIAERETYIKSIECFMEIFDGTMECGIGIVHLGASYEERKKRNLERRKTTGQFLPDIVLENVFKQDVFHRTSNDLLRTVDTETVLIRGKKVPVFSIMNAPQKTPDEVDRFLTQTAHDATNYFGF